MLQWRENASYLGSDNLSNNKTVSIYHIHAWIPNQLTMLYLTANLDYCLTCKLTLWWSLWSVGTSYKKWIVICNWNTSLQAVFNTSQIATNFNLRWIDILIYSLDCNGVFIFLRFFKMQKKEKTRAFFIVSQTVYPVFVFYAESEIILP